MLFDKCGLCCGSDLLTHLLRLFYESGNISRWYLYCWPIFNLIVAVSIMLNHHFFNIFGIHVPILYIRFLTFIFKSEIGLEISLYLPFFLVWNQGHFSLVSWVGEIFFLFFSFTCAVYIKSGLYSLMFGKCCLRPFVPLFYLWVHFSYSFNYIGLESPFIFYFFSYLYNLCIYEVVYFM